MNTPLSATRLTCTKPLSRSVKRLENNMLCRHLKQIGFTNKSQTISLCAHAWKCTLAIGHCRLLATVGCLFKFNLLQVHSPFHRRSCRYQWSNRYCGVFVEGAKTWAVGRHLIVFEAAFGVDNFSKKAETGNPMNFPGE